MITINMWLVLQISFYISWVILSFFLAAFMIGGTALENWFMAGIEKLLALELGFLILVMLLISSILIHGGIFWW